MAAEVEMPKIDTTTRSLSKQKLVLVLDRIADPGTHTFETRFLLP